MSESARVSVVIPTFDRRETIERAVRSVLAQSLPPFEVIVVDDGSTDHTYDHLRQTYPQIIALRQPHSGVSRARNCGIENAKGHWVAFLDSDDEWLPDKLEIQLEAMRDQPDYRICHTDEVWIRRGVRVNPRKIHRKSGGCIFDRCLPMCVVSPSSVLLERSLLEEVGGFDESLPACEDYDLWLRIFLRHPVCYVDQPLVVKYGGHADQLSRNIWGLDRFRIRALTKLLDTEPLSEEQRKRVVAVLLQKIDIVVAGAAKRG